MADWAMVRIPADLYEEVKRKAEKKYGRIRGAIGIYLAEVIRKGIEADEGEREPAEE